MIKIIDTLELTPDGVRLGGTSKVHLRQGELDGACAVYSLMMYLIILRIFTYKQVTEGNNIKRSTSKGRIIRNFLERQDGLIRKELGFADDIKDGLQFAAKSIVDCNYIASRQETIETLKRCIDDNKPLMIGVDYNKVDGHALLAIGYETRNDKIKKIFCLDPGSDITPVSYWNAVISIDEHSNTKYRNSYFTANGNVNKVTLADAIKIENKK